MQHPVCVHKIHRRRNISENIITHCLSITAWLRKFSEEQNLPHINPHAFRHTAASTMIANGVDIVTAANELGHANATTTANIYAHQIALAKAKAAEARAGVFSDRDKVTRRRRNK